MGTINKIFDWFSVGNIPFPGVFAYFFIFFLSFLESSPFFGLVIPGVLIIASAGFLAKLGFLKIWYVFLSAFFGAVCGDFIGYIIGRKYGHSFLFRFAKYFSFKEVYYQKIKKLINFHAGKTLIIGRLNGLTRSFAPFVAGTSEVPFSRFMLFNLIGGALWAVLYVLIGYLFGSFYVIILKYFERTFFALLILIAVLAILYFFIKKISIKKL